MEHTHTGKIELAYTHHTTRLQIVSLFTHNEDGQKIPFEVVNVLANEKRVPTQINKELVQWYIKKANTCSSLLQNITIAHSYPAVKKGSHQLRFTQTEFDPFNEVYWNFVHILFKHMSDDDIKDKLPFQLLFAKKNEVIATHTDSYDDKAGKTIMGELIPISHSELFIYSAGDNVVYDSVKKTFSAKESGYVTLHENKLSIVPPFYVSQDNVTLSFINYNRLPAAQIEFADIEAFTTINSIAPTMIKGDFRLDAPIGTPVVVAEGKRPGESIDASVEYFVETELQYASVDDKGQIDYREVKKFPSVVKDECLAKKKMPITGEAGTNLYGISIPARIPKDVIMKNGVNTYKKETPEAVLLYATTDGLIEFKNGILSIYGELAIPGDVDFSSGHIDTKVNVNIVGNVRTGFNVKSEKNIFIKGMIEDGCKIEAGGDLIVNGGSAGQTSSLTSGGNMSIKFIEGGTITVKGNLAVHSFILSSKVSCNGNVTIMGAGLNMNEKGAIIDSEVSLKGSLYCPSVGNDKGMKTYINFACDKALNTKIKNLEETLQKINKNIDDIKARFPDIDITSSSISMKIQKLSKQIKDAIIAAIQEKNKLDSQYKMMENILNKEYENRKINQANSSVNITKKTFPPLTLECDGAKRFVDKEGPPSKFVYNIEEKRIDRERYFGMGGDEG